MTISKIKTFSFGIYFILFSSVLIAQHFEHFDVPVIQDGDALKFGFAGGMNCPQFSQADLNNDGIDDIFVFDREGNVPMVFIADGQGGYEYDRSFSMSFPRMREWAIMRDFNNDGIPDLLTYSLQVTSSIRVFEGKWDNGMIAFDQVTWPDQDNIKQDVLHRYTIDGDNLSKTNFEIYVFNVDVPAFYDIDGDGDLDLLTFESGGFYLNYFRNYSVEQGYGTDSLLFVLEDNCFGKFYESGLAPALDLSDDPNECFQPGGVLNDYSPENRDLRHAGSTITALDATGNGLTDILLGDITFEVLVLATNGGTIDNAHMTDQDVSFPSYDVPVNIEYFPAAYIIDVDHDDQKDMIVSPNQKDPLQNLDVAWYYKDVSTTGVPRFELQDKQFLVGDMLDFGTGANPAFFDYNGDGLLDLVVGMYDEFVEGESGFHSRLVLYENIGTSEDPVFELVNEDYLNFSTFLEGSGSFDFVPYFADIDGDGDLDLFVGEYSGNLYFAENLAGPGVAAEFGPVEFGWQSILSEVFFVPYLWDLDGDGLLDIIYGDRRGEVRLLRNIGSITDPQFNPDLNDPINIRRVGDFTVRGPGSFTGMSAPQIVYHNGIEKLIVGSHSDGINIYEVQEDDLETAFPKVLDDPVASISDGVRLRPAFADITNNGFLEMVVGNFRGGLTLYKTPYSYDRSVSNTSNHTNQQALSWRVNPNPATNYIQIDIQEDNYHFNTVFDIQILDPLGRIVKQHTSASRSIELPIDQLKPGVYFVSILRNGFSTTKKFIKQ